MVEIEATGPLAESHIHGSIDAAFGLIAQVGALMSYHDSGSELSRLNREAHRTAQRVDRHTFAVLEGALRMATLSEGAFDPTVAPTLEASGHLPSLGAGDEADPDATFADIELLEGGRVRYLRPLRVDLGGVAKGYAVDLAIDSLRRAGLSEVLVNAGGDLRVSGRRRRRIHLRDPATLLPGPAVDLQDAAVATSAAYFSRRSSPGGLASALVSPARGRPYVGDLSVSVVASDAMTADALTKAVLFLTEERARPLLGLCGAQAFVQMPRCDP